MEYKIIDQEERFFAGIEHHKELVFGVNEDIGISWKKMFHEAYDVILMKTEPHQMIGLNCNSIDYDETHTVTYYALAETIDLIPQKESIVTKKIPAGKYICFEVNYSTLGEERRKVYDYCKKENINVHEGFDYEHFLNHVDYGSPNAVLELCLKLEND